MKFKLKIHKVLLCFYCVVFFLRIKFNCIEKQKKKLKGIASFYKAFQVNSAFISILLRNSKENLRGFLGLLLKDEEFLKFSMIFGIFQEKN